MIARLHLSLPTWPVVAPIWTHLVQRVAIDRPHRPERVPDAERLALRAARNQRAERLRVDAERHMHGLPVR